MLALHDRPTPAPMSGNDEECATLVWKGSRLGAGGAGKEGARASTPPDAAASDPRAAPGDVNAPRDSYLVRSWSRLRAGARRFGDAMAHAFFGGVRLTDWLPPVPPMRSGAMTRVSAGVIPDQDFAEHMLLCLVRAPSAYQRAAVEVAYQALAARRAGDDAHTEFVVHFALSRMAPDRDGGITTERLQDRLCHMSYKREIAPALIRLEARGVVSLRLQDSKSDPMREILREGIIAVELRCQP